MTKPVVGDKVGWTENNIEYTGVVVKDVTDKCLIEQVAVKLDTFSQENKLNPAVYYCVSLLGLTIFK